ncbi:MAG: ORF6N domain-containing protein [Candidatus Omnitrophica bacterium]|nr:ORF6N domain-containing protein [Candidatus Omnitrophota bacterium]
MGRKRSVAKKSIIPDEIIERKIYIIRGKKVMLDRDLAELYGVTTGRLNEQVKRNRKRFPSDFMCQVTKSEFTNLISQNAISSWGGVRKLPYAFTEQGVAMLSSVLNSDRAIEVNIQIMRAFVRIRQLIVSHKDLQRKIDDLEKKMEEKFGIYDEQFVIVFQAFEELKKALRPTEKPKRRIGFHQE